jgi:hypothetical protein
MFMYVPAACIPVAQPLDAGIISKFKSVLRRLYGEWIIKLALVSDHLGPDRTGLGDPKTFVVPNSLPKLLRGLITAWISVATKEVPDSLVQHCWEKCGIMDAWKKDYQDSAVEVGAEALFGKDVAPGVPVAEDLEVAEIEDADEHGDSIWRDEREQELGPRGDDDAELDDEEAQFVVRLVHGPGAPAAAAAGAASVLRLALPVPAARARPAMPPLAPTRQVPLMAMVPPTATAAGRPAAPPGYHYYHGGYDHGAGTGAGTVLVLVLVPRWRRRP